MERVEGVQLLSPGADRARVAAEEGAVARVARGHQHPVLRPVLRDRAEHRRLGPGVLHLHVDPRCGERLEHLRQRADARARAPEGKARPAVRGETAPGVQAAQLREGPVANRAGAVGGALEGGVVEDDAVAVGGGPDVDLQHVGAPPFDRLAERRQRVLGGEQRAAPMGDEQRRPGQVPVAGARSGVHRGGGQRRVSPAARARPG